MGRIEELEKAIKEEEKFIEDTNKLVAKMEKKEDTVRNLNSLNAMLRQIHRAKQNIRKLKNDIRAVHHKKGKKKAEGSFSRELRRELAEWESEWHKEHAIFDFPTLEDVPIHLQELYQSQRELLNEAKPLRPIFGPAVITSDGEVHCCDENGEIPEDIKQGEKFYAKPRSKEEIERIERKIRARRKQKSFGQ
jgi:DNA repair exonuclease SbcCD ATPase subunit